MANLVQRSSILFAASALVPALGRAGQTDDAPQGTVGPAANRHAEIRP